MMPINENRTYDNNKLNKDFLRRDGRNLSDDYLKKIFEEEERIESKMKSAHFTRFFQDAELLLDMMKNYWSGEYKSVPYATALSAILGVFYILNPLDLVPDFIPILGQIDDIAVLGLCFYLLEKDMKKYQNWKSTQGVDEYQGGRYPVS